MEKSQEESKLLPQDSASPQVIPDEAESAEERETEECESRVCLEDEEIRGEDAETRVVLLPVNPHLVYVYWEISATDLAEIGRVFSRLGPRAQPVLRFYRAALANRRSLDSASEFELAVALGAGKWYVHLEHPAHSYCLDLGLRLARGSFHLLARSNLAEMPKACPSDETEEHYLLVEDGHAPAEVVVATEEGRSTSPSAHSRDETPGLRGRLQDYGETSRTVRACAELPGREENWPEYGGASGPVPPSAAPPGEEAKLLVDPRASHSHPRYYGSQGEGEMDRGYEPIVPAYSPSARDMERQLAEFHQQRNWERAWWAPGVQGGEEFHAAANLRTDLTELSERSFRAGLSSGQKSP